MVGLNGIQSCFVLVLVTIVLNESGLSKLTASRAKKEVLLFVCLYRRLYFLLNNIKDKDIGKFIMELTFHPKALVALPQTQKNLS